MSRRNNNAPARLHQDYLNLRRDPVPLIVAEPLPNNILEWRYVIDGPIDTPYFGGVYQGKLIFPVEYPFKPPSILMITPNGRFNVNTRLCLSMSDYHPETWNPSWSVGSILNGLLSFMVGTDHTTGAIWGSTSAQKMQYAKDSLELNLADKVFCDLFPDKAEQIRRAIASRSQMGQNTAGQTGQAAQANAPLRPNDLLLILVCICFLIFLYAIVISP